MAAGLSMSAAISPSFLSALWRLTSFFPFSIIKGDSVANGNPDPDQARGTESSKTCYVFDILQHLRRWPSGCIIIRKPPKPPGNPRNTTETPTETPRKPRGNPAETPRKPHGNPAETPWKPRGNPAETPRKGDHAWEQCLMAMCNVRAPHLPQRERALCYCICGEHRANTTSQRARLLASSTVHTTRRETKPQRPRKPRSPPRQRPKETVKQ